MKPIWYKIGMACVLISAIGRMADEPLAVLIVIGILVVIFLIVRLYDKGKMFGVFVFAISGIVLGILWYLTRWRRRWVKILKTFMPKDKIRHGDWKMREKYFQTFDYATKARLTTRMSIRMLPHDWIHLRGCLRGVILKPSALWLTSPVVSMPI